MVSKPVRLGPCWLDPTLSPCSSNLGPLSSLRVLHSILTILRTSSGRRPLMLCLQCTGILQFGFTGFIAPNTTATTMWNTVFHIWFSCSLCPGTLQFSYMPSSWFCCLIGLPHLSQPSGVLSPLGFDRLCSLVLSCWCLRKPTAVTELYKQINMLHRCSCTLSRCRVFTIYSTLSWLVLGFDAI